MIAVKGRLSYVQYLPAKPIDIGIMVWMYCDADTTYLHQFEVYLSQQFGLGYDMVMTLYKDISGKIIICLVTICLHLSSYQRTYWLAIHTAMGQYE